MPEAFEPPDHRVAGVIRPVDDVDEFAFEEVENHVRQSLGFTTDDVALGGVGGAAGRVELGCA
jgi:hypothetical protein